MSPRSPSTRFTRPPTSFCEGDVPDVCRVVRAYAEVLRQEPSAYEAIYNWEIYFFTEAGDVWLPTGFVNEQTLDLAEFLAANPWSLPDEGLRAREPDSSDTDSRETDSSDAGD